MDLLDRLRLDVPVGQAGMGGGLAGAALAVAVAKAATSASSARPQPASYPPRSIGFAPRRRVVPLR
ncbi:hypothetical protein AWC22_10390 [Mycobacterium riyadhense]|uniref:Uncharacterized protein n=1 Tax=Mycobacterium riyadhense TaxID=486698 RepID=A0A1X2DF76_9MYCO|nr:hypothetical protein [Mycobacterium riyadhense]ORW86865.1 hypothetical protein AWC22_10390 [Mycobacterium riyadhense]